MFTSEENKMHWDAVKEHIETKKFEEIHFNHSIIFISKFSEDSVGYTVYLKEHDNIIAQGDSKEEAISNLLKVYQVIKEEGYLDEV